MPSRNIARPLLASFLLFLAVVATFGRTTGHPFITFDDPQYVTINPVVSGGFSTAGAAWAFRSVEQSNWHPLTWLSHMADVSLFGTDPRWHHGENVVLHGLGAILLFLSLRALTGEEGKSLAVAALFALHPLRVEPVAWVAQRKELLCALFWFLGMAAWARYVRLPSVRRYAAPAASFVLALMSKPMAVTFPMVLLLLDYWPLRRFSFSPPRGAGEPEGQGHLPAVPTGRLLLEKAPLLLLAVASSAVTYLAQSGGRSTAGDALPLAGRLENALVSAASYLGKIFLPMDMAIYYPHPFLTGEGIATWKWGAALFLLVAATAVVLLRRRTHPFLPVGWFWFLGTLVPVIGLVQVGLQSMADRYTHLPSVGISIAVVWWTASLLPAGAGGRRAGTALAVAAALLLGGGALVQAGYWRSSSALFERAVAVGGESFVSLDLLGLAYASEGRHGEAVETFTKALRLRPSDPKLWSNLAVSCDEAGRPDRAASAYRELLRLRPRMGEVRGRLAVALAKAGDHSGALSALAEGADASHGDVSLFPLLAGHYEKAGRFPLAVSVYEEMVRRSPDHAEGWNNLGVDYASLGRFDLAYGAFMKAVSFRPGWGEAWYNAGVAAALGGRRKEAREALSALASTDPARVPALESFLSGGGR